MAGNVDKLGCKVNAEEAFPRTETSDPAELATIVSEEAGDVSESAASSR